MPRVPMTHPLVPLLETSRVQLSLRVVSRQPCQLAPYGVPIHNTQVPWREQQTMDWIEYGMPDAGDPLWPAYCRCGFQFRKTDLHLVVPERLYRISPEELVTLREAPVGACWYAPWMHSGATEPDVLWSGPDQRCMVVQTPAGEWWLDGPSRQVPDGRGWIRTGDSIDTTTCTPSVRIGVWSGYLHGGVLHDGEIG